MILTSATVSLRCGSISKAHTHAHAHPQSHTYTKEHTHTHSQMGKVVIRTPLGIEFMLDR